MRIESLNSLAAVVLAGSLAMERLVTVVKTIGPTVFGEPGPTPGGPIGVLDDARRVDALGRTWTKEQARRVWVLLLVNAASLLTAWLVSDPTTTGCRPASWLCRDVAYGKNEAVSWWLFAILISGGSAVWTNVVGYMSALKDVKAGQGTDPSKGATVVVVNAADRPHLGVQEPPMQPPR